MGTELFAGITTTVPPVEVFEFNGRRENEDKAFTGKPKKKKAYEG